MIRFVLLSLIFMFLHPPQDCRVVTYSTGKINTNTYEGLSFWIKDNQKAYIRYAHGVDTTDLDLSWAGLVTLKEETGFKAQFPAPDTNCFYILPQGHTLKVIDKSGKYLLLYSLENESQAGDCAPGCSDCAKGEKGARRLMQQYLL